MPLNRSAVFTGMLLAGRMAAIDHDVDSALPRAKRDDNTPIRPHRHETGWRDQLNRKDKQRQRGQKAPRGF